MFNVVHPLKRLQRLHATLLEDMAAICARDPAATGFWTILLCYPGLHAVWGHRIAHKLWRKPRLRLLARLWAHGVRATTGIEIHPAAVLGRRCVIDHGMGVVIGETAVVGNDALMFQGVTLGGTGKPPHGKRHPTLGNNVTLGANATLLGNITIGDNAVIGASAVVLRSVTANVTVKGVASHQAKQLVSLNEALVSPCLDAGAGI